MSDEQRSLDRLWLRFALSSVVFAAVLAISPVKGYLSEYRVYQNAYRRLLLDKAGSARELREARAQTVGIHQIWLPRFDNRADRCVTCHLGVENAKMLDARAPYGVHPLTAHTPADFQRFGCVSCHRGQGRATSRDEAHGEVPNWDSPLLPIRYTEASCGRCHLGDQVPGAALLSAGRALMDRAGCYGCHKLEGHERWSSGAPSLDGLSQKTHVEWLRGWLRSPRSLQPETWMPDFKLSDAEIEALAAFLWVQPHTAAQDIGAVEEPPPGDAARGRTLLGQARCVSCHTVEGRGNGSAPELAGIGSKVNRKWLVAYLSDPHAFQPRTRMPRYNFSRRDVLDLSQYLMEELIDPEAAEPGPAWRPPQKLVQEGEDLYRRYACGSCHRIAGREDAVQAGPDLTGIGDKPIELLDFGRRDDLPRKVPDWLAAKVSQPRSFREGLKMPDFGFEPEQIEAIVTALLSSGEPVRPAFRVPAPEPRYSPPGRFGELMAKYRCLSCHQVEGFGGDISTAPLTAEGSRVKKDWLVGYLLRPSTIRPILTDRMIPLWMPESEAAFLADFMKNVFVDSRVPVDGFAARVEPQRVERGRKLFFERYGCQSCHMVGGSGGYYGPLLDGAGRRLEPGWIVWWLQGPQRWRADVRCPDYGLDEADARDLAAYVTSIPAPAASSGGSGGGT